MNDIIEYSISQEENKFVKKELMWKLKLLGIYSLNVKTFPI